MKKALSIVLVFAMLLSVCLPAGAAGDQEAMPIAASAALPIYKDASYSYAERAVDLVSRMTLAEKASQTAGYNAPAIPRLGVAGYMWWNEALHGYSQEGWFGIQTDGASYPSSYSMGASWDPDLYYKEAEQIGEEIRERVKGNTYNLTMFSPNVNLARDPRWGRNDESYGEDALLVGTMASSFVNGVEGKKQDGSYKLTNANGDGKKQVVTTIKHYCANNSEKNRYTSGADNATVREMREYYTKASKIVVKNADVSSVMMAYSSVGGVPISFSSYYMDTVLRQTFGFSGYIVSDCDSIATSFNRNVHKNNPHTGKNYTLGEAYANAMANGLDLQCNAGETDGLGSYASNYKAMLGQTTDKGKYTEQQLEVSVARLMQKRMELGEFDEDNTYAKTGAERRKAGDEGGYVNGVVGQTQERIDLADDLSRSTIVLLKNENNALPITEEELSAKSAYEVGIIGPVGQSNFRGGYSSSSRNEANLVTIEQAIKTAFADTDTYKQSTIDKVNVNYHYGFKGMVSRNSFSRLATADIDLSEVKDGLDLAIVVVGEGSGDSREDGDRTNLHLGQAQIDLIQAVKAKNPKKLVLVMETYGPVQMSSDIVDNADAILWSGFNGFRKGTGFGEAITGKNNPSGRTNATWLADTIEDIPDFFDYSIYPSNGKGGRTYMYNVEKTIYPFGYGLSYADVTYAPVTGKTSILGANTKGGLTVNGVNRDSKLNVAFQITNTNNVAGKQVAEVYVVSPGAGKDNLPQKRLVGFKKVAVDANGTTEVEIPVDMADFGFFNEDKDCYEIPTGKWQIWVARSSDLNAETDLCEEFTIADGTIREDPEVITVKPTQAGDDESISERVIFNLSADASKNIIEPNVAVTMTNEKLYGVRVLNNVPGKDIGVSAAEADKIANATEGKYSVPDTAKDAARLEDGKKAEELPRVGTKFVLPDSYTVAYESNRPSVVAVEDGKLVMKNAGVATITVKVTSPAGVTAETDFAVAVKGTAALTAISVGGKALDCFDGNTKSYTCVVDQGAPVEVKATPVAGASVKYSAANATGGFSASAPKVSVDAKPVDVYIKVSGDQVPEQTYIVKLVARFTGDNFYYGKMKNSWEIVNEDKDGYKLVEGLGLYLPYQQANLSATASWKNLFTKPIGGNWTMVTKLNFMDSFLNVNGQQIQFLQYQDMNNMVKATLQAGGGFMWGWGGGSTAPTSTSFNIAPTVDGATNGSTSHTTTMKPSDNNASVYVKIQHTDMRFDIWYSMDGVNYTKVQSADGRRTGESSYLPDAVFGMFVTGTNADSKDKGLYVEYMTVTEQEGVEVISEQKMLDDAFAAVADHAKKELNGKLSPISDDIKLTLPADYTVKFIAEDGLTADGKLIPGSGRKQIKLKVILSHPTATINGSHSVEIFNSTANLDAGAPATAYHTENTVVNTMVGDTKALYAVLTQDIMSVSFKAEDESIAKVAYENGLISITGLKKGTTKVIGTWYGMPNNVELGTTELIVNVNGAEMFDDVNAGAWFFAGADYAVEKGLMNGVGKNLFNPNGKLTRAQLVTILYRVAGSPETAYTGKFKDVPEGQWFTKAVEWAAAQGIVTGYDGGIFKPNGFISREQIATILFRAEGEPTVDGGKLDFPDAETAHDYAKDALIWATSKGLINGVKSGDITYLKPLDTATRAQFATIAQRYLEDVAKKPE